MQMSDKRDHPMNHTTWYMSVAPPGNYRSELQLLAIWNKVKIFQIQMILT